jgi:hypothetical protein
VNELRHTDRRSRFLMGVRFSRSVLAAWVVLALLWAQILGQGHGVVHIGHTQPSVVASVQAQGAKHAPSIPSVIARLFPSHEDAADCLFFDQLSHGDAVVPVLSLTLPLAGIPVLMQCSHALFIARWHAQFQARGPPFFR